MRLREFLKKINVQIEDHPEFLDYQVVVEEYTFHTSTSFPVTAISPIIIENDKLFRIMYYYPSTDL